MRIMGPNYSKSLNGVALSILKFCGIDVVKGNLRNIDRILKEEEYDNIVVLMYSGLSISLLNRYATECEFLTSHLEFELTSVCPATASSALSTLVSGKVPLEHRLFGNYSKNFDENVIFGNIVNNEFIAKINSSCNIKAYGVLPFGVGAYTNISEAYDRIISISSNKGRKLIFGYFNDLAEVLSKNGVCSDLVKNKLADLNSILKGMLEILENSLVLILSDGGYSDCSDIMVNDHPEILKLIDEVVVADNRFCSFKINSNFEDFKSKFIYEFGNSFLILSKHDVKDKNLFGCCDSNSIDLDFDCVVIGKGDKRLNFGSKINLDKASNAGLTKDELLIPLVVLKKKLSRELIRQTVDKDYPIIHSIFKKMQLNKVDARRDIFHKFDALTSFEFSKLCSRVSDRICLVYEKEEQILGLIVLRSVIDLGGQFNNQYGYLSIERIYVLEEYRRQGIGTKLYEESLKIAKKWHFKKVEVQIWNFEDDVDLFFKKISDSKELYKVLEVDV